MANTPLTFVPRPIVLCGQTAAGAVIPIKTANAAGFADIGQEFEYGLACGRDTSANIVPILVDADGDPI